MFTLTTNEYLARHSAIIFRTSTEVCIWECCTYASIFTWMTGTSVIPTTGRNCSCLSCPQNQRKAEMILKHFVFYLQPHFIYKV